MSELSNKPVDNGNRLPVKTSFFAGMAGVRQNATGGTFACAARPPLLFEPEGTVDGRPVRILDVQKSDVSAGLLVARFDYEETTS